MGRNKSLEFDENVNPNEYLRLYQMGVEARLMKNMRTVLTETLIDYVPKLPASRKASRNDRRYVGYKEAIEMSGLSYSFFYRKVNDNELEECGVGNHRFRVSDILSIMQDKGIPIESVGSAQTSR